MKKNFKSIARAAFSLLLALGLVLNLNLAVYANGIDGGSGVIENDVKGQPVQPFADVSRGHVAYDAIKAVTEQGIMRGYENGEFRPANPLTRAELYRTLANVCDAPQWDKTTGEHWAQAAIDYLTDKGFVAPTTETADSPYYAEKMTRGEAAYVLYNVFAALGVTPLSENDPAITDLASAPVEYQENIKNAYKAEIVAPFGNVKMFYPNGNLDRAELCRWIYNSGIVTELPCAPVADRGPVLAAVYTINNGGFADSGTKGEVKTLTMGGTLYYDLTDCAKLVDMEITVDPEQVSSVFYHSDADGQPVYDVPALRVTMGDRVVELTSDYCCVNETGYQAAKHFYKDGAVYVSGATLRSAMPEAVVDVKGNLNVLKTDGKQLGFVSASNTLSDKEKTRLATATWLVYNLYPEGYETVIKYTNSVESLTEAELTTTAKVGGSAYSGNSNMVGYAKTGSNRTVYLLDTVLDSSPDVVAPVLVHEATHYRDFASNNVKEDGPVLEQVKMAYALYKAGSKTYSNKDLCTKAYTTNDATDPYYQGYVLANKWLAEQK